MLLHRNPETVKTRGEAPPNSKEHSGDPHLRKEELLASVKDNSKHGDKVSTPWPFADFKKREVTNGSFPSGHHPFLPFFSIFFFFSLRVNFA